MTKVFPTSGQGWQNSKRNLGISDEKELIELDCPWLDLHYYLFDPESREYMDAQTKGSEVQQLDAIAHNNCTHNCSL